MTTNRNDARPASRRVALSATLFAFLCGACAVQAQDAKPDAPSLLAPAPVGARPATSVAPVRGVVNSQLTGVELAALSNLGTGTITRVRLPMFGKGERTLHFTRREDHGPGRFALTGELEGVASSTVGLAVWDGVVTLEARALGERPVRLRSSGTGGYWLEEIELSECGQCGVGAQEPLSHVEAKDSSSEPAKSISQAVASTLPADRFTDLLVYYTPPARTAAGGDNAIKSKITNQVALSNSAHSRGNNGEGSHLYIRLLDIRLLDYSTVEATAEDFISKLETNNDGAMDEVFAGRTELGADTIFVWATWAEFAVAGIARVGDPSPTSFGAVNLNSIGSDLVFTHEFGHTIGCRHEVGADPGGTYNHAYSLFVFAQFKTSVMWSQDGAWVDPGFSDPTYVFTDVFNNSYPFGTSTANNMAWIVARGETYAKKTNPKFWMTPGGGSNVAGTPLNPTRDLNHVLGLFDFTRAPSDMPSGTYNPIVMESGNYSAPGLRITKRARLEKWRGTGNVRIAQ